MNFKFLKIFLELRRRSYCISWKGMCRKENRILIGGWGRKAGCVFGQVVVTQLPLLFPNALFTALSALFPFLLTELLTDSGLPNSKNPYKHWFSRPFTHPYMRKNNHIFDPSIPFLPTASDEIPLFIQFSYKML